MRAGVRCRSSNLSSWKTKNGSICSSCTYILSSFHIILLFCKRVVHGVPFSNIEFPCRFAPPPPSRSAAAFLGCDRLLPRTDVVCRSQVIRGSGQNNECQDTAASAAAAQLNNGSNGHGTANQASGVGLQSHHYNTSSYKASKTLRMPSAPINSAEQARLLG